MKMEQLNRYYRRSKVGERKFCQVLFYFAHDLKASKTVEPVGLSRLTTTLIFGKVRLRIAQEAERASPFKGVVEVDESHFRAHLVCAQRGRGAAEKTIIFSIFKRNGAVYTEIVPNCKKATL